MNTWYIARIIIQAVLFLVFALMTVGRKELNNGWSQLHLTDFLSWKGGLSRGAYLIGGLLLFYMVALFVHAVLMTRGYEPVVKEYLWILTGLLTYFGIVLTVKRLRTLKLPVWLAALFAIPGVNFFTMVLFSIIPDSQARPFILHANRFQRLMDRIIPGDAAGSGLMAIWLTAMLGSLAIFLGTEILKTYGTILFAAGPFVLGWLAVGFYTHHEERSLGSCIKIVCLSFLLLSVIVVMFAIEGLICVVMALPLAIPLGIIGGLIGYVNQKALSKDQMTKTIPLVIISIPLLMGAEFAIQPVPQVLPVKTTVEIAASVETVWKNVIAFPALPQPQAGIFSIGIAYPKYASITGTGVGAVRECHFSTGAFVEPITVWDENKLLRFDVTSQPAPMKEISPYGDIHTPHMDNYLLSKQGQFLLTELPNGKVRLEGTTWYSNKMWPEPYWRMWSDHIIHEIHLRVLEHIKTISEEERAI